MRARCFAPVAMRIRDPTAMRYPRAPLPASEAIRRPSARASRPLDDLLLVSYRTLARASDFFYYLELGGTIHRMGLVSIASMTADRPAPAAQPWARLQLPQ